MKKLKHIKQVMYYIICKPYLEVKNEPPLFLGVAQESTHLKDGILRVIFALTKPWA